VKILIDMNLSPTWVEVFAKHNIVSIHWSTVGDPRATDRTIMNWASANSYIVFTHDLDFSALLAATQTNRPSVIQVRTQDVLPANLENLIINAIAQFGAALEAGALITIDEARSRVRILPLN
jgi:predicted nuclease of predicted toxin-antitoxin system